MSKRNQATLVSSDPDIKNELWTNDVWIRMVATVGFFFNQDKNIV